MSTDWLEYFNGKMTEEGYNVQEVLDQFEGDLPPPDTPLREAHGTDRNPFCVLEHSVEIQKGDKNYAIFMGRAYYGNPRLLTDGVEVNYTFGMEFTIGKRKRSEKGYKFLIFDIFGEVAYLNSMADSDEGIDNISE